MTLTPQQRQDFEAAAPWLAEMGGTTTENLLWNFNGPNSRSCLRKLKLRDQLERALSKAVREIWGGYLEINDDHRAEPYQWFYITGGHGYDMAGEALAYHEDRDQALLSACLAAHKAHLEESNG